MRLPKLKFILAFLDFVIVLASFYESRLLLIRYLHVSLSSQYPAILGVSYTFLFSSIIFAFVFVFLFQNNQLYKINIFLSRSAQIVAIVKSIFYGVLLLVLFSFLLKFSLIIDSRLLVISIAILTTLNIILLRVFLIRSIYLKYTANLPTRRKVAIVGAGESGKLLATKVNFEEIYGLELIGFIDDQYHPETLIHLGKKNLGHINDLDEIKRIYGIEELIISIDNISYESLLSLIDLCNRACASVKLNSQLFDILPKKVQLESYANVPVIEVSPRMNGNIGFLLKRIFDVVFSIIGLIFLSPILLLISVAIKISSKGPVLYKQIRIGKNGKPFMFYKFRSMRISDEEDTERIVKMIDFMKNNKTDGNGHTKIINESRLSWIGKLIRKTSIDELPQLINVIKGEMSLVGPRPCLPYEWENYDNWQKRRANVLPGCTGVWQVSGRSDVSFNDSIILDLYYINYMSPWLDLQIVLKTIPVMIFGRGGR